MQSRTRRGATRARDDGGGANVQIVAIDAAFPGGALAVPPGETRRADGDGSVRIRCAIFFTMIRSSASTSMWSRALETALALAMGWRWRWRWVDGWWTVSDLKRAARAVTDECDVR